MKGQRLWTKASALIPGGNQLLSKRPERFLPGAWPAYYQKAKGCEVWDLDGNHYFDFAQMGVGCCVLGYADEDVNRAVEQAVRRGSMCTLNPPEEVELAERMVSLHPWAAMARFARTGAEACAIAVRIARAATNRDKVAFCGYHGWHDWYLAANIADQRNLDGQLLPGLPPTGVPRGLRETALPFAYNDLSALESIVARFPDDIGVIIMEPQRGLYPAPDFLNGVRQIANRIGAILIFDEVTSGFRTNLGGIHLEYGVEPDLAVFGKALGNGYPVSAVIGREEVMRAADETFISSTLWTDLIGPVAALATLEKMETHNVPPELTRYGELINQGWRVLSERHEVPIEISGIPPLTHLKFKTDEPEAAQTLYAQEMLKKGYLLGSAVYTTYAYSEEIIQRFVADSDAAFAMIRRALMERDFGSYLDGEAIKMGFKRLTQ